jgi:hypothetical protein
MRKIEAKMLSAIDSRGDFKLDNTQVVTIADVSWVYLHRNLIAEINKDYLTVFDAGWRTLTTKSRLNSILRAFTNDFGISQHDWEWYLTGPDGAIVWEGEHTLDIGAGHEFIWKTVKAITNK